MARVLLDTGFLLAISYDRDENHRRALSARRSLTGERVIAAPVLVELFWMLNSNRIHLEFRSRYRKAVQILDDIQRQFTVEPLTAADMQRMTDIMRIYADSRFDYVDTAIMALAERLNITTVCTFDQRDFLTFRPKHTNAFTLLP